MLYKKVVYFCSFLILVSMFSVKCMEIFELINRGYTTPATNFINNKTFDPNIKNENEDPLIFVLVQKEYTALATTVISKPQFNPHLKNKKGEKIASVLISKGYTSLLDKVFSHPNFNDPQYTERSDSANNGISYKIALSIVEEELGEAKKRIAERFQVIGK